MSNFESMSNVAIFDHLQGRNSFRICPPRISDLDLEFKDQGIVYPDYGLHRNFASWISNGTFSARNPFSYTTIWASRKKSFQLIRHLCGRLSVVQVGKLSESRLCKWLFITLARV
ncbi:hypothetical protein CEXT_772581 [Caerostris extrusa]|uniref:Uncharacterized protein n=1 Tax=Caerostris extrusa TaxID=172846 RepID=A0AAV4NQY3_CAEEX|nr:hypothetical protein CEXT_772581 [Caerostris extrusa]